LSTFVRSVKILFKIGDIVQFNPEFFKGTKESLLEEFGSAQVTSDVTDNWATVDGFQNRVVGWSRALREAPLRTWRSAQRRRFGMGVGAGILFVNLKWNDEQDIHWEYVDCLCLVQIKQNMFVILDNQLKQAEKM